MNFTRWVLQAWDGQGWRVLFDANGTAYWAENTVREFTIDEPIASNRYRIVRPESFFPGPLPQCFHPNPFELFGTIIAPWQPSVCCDRDQPNRNTWDFYWPDGTYTRKYADPARDDEPTVQKTFADGVGLS